MSLTEKLRELAELRARATPGPWYHHHTDDRSFMNCHCISTSPFEPDLLNGEACIFAHEMVAYTLLQDPRVASHTAACWDYDADFTVGAANADWRALLAEAERLEAQNARLRELVREAWDEGFEVGDVGNPRRSGWAMSKVKAALDALDKEGSDA